MGKHITTSNRELLRVDVVSLQSALLTCLSIAERGITRGAKDPLVYLDALKGVVEAARNGVSGADEWQADNAVRVIADAASTQ